MPTLPNLLTMPLMPGETENMRARAVLHATKDLSELERIEHLVNSITRPLDLDLDVAGPSHRPGILADFALNHPWLWWESAKFPGKFTSDAHKPLIAACHDLWLLTMMKRGRGTGGAAMHLIRQKFVNVDKRWLNPWFVPHDRSALSQEEAVAKIMNFYGNRVRRVKQINRARCAHKWVVWGCFYRYQPIDDRQRQIGPLEVQRELYIGGRYPPFSVFFCAAGSSPRHVGFMPQSMFK